MLGQILIFGAVLAACGLVWRPRRWPARLALRLPDHRLGLALLALLYLLALASLRPRIAPLAYDDSARYQAAAQQADLMNTSFWLGDSPPLISAYFAAFGRDTEQAGLFVTANLLLHGLAWFSFGLVLARLSGRGWWRVAVLGWALAFSLALDVVMWTGTLLGETLSLSLMLLWLAAWLRLLNRLEVGRPWEGSAALLGLCALLFVLARDVHLYAVLLLALAFLPLALWRGRKALAWRTCALVLLASHSLIFIVYEPIASASTRWHFPMVNNIGWRILVDEGHTAWMVARGMPMNPLVECYRDRPASAFGQDFSGFGTWLSEGQARRDYAAFLLSRLPESLAEVAAFWPDLIDYGAILIEAYPPPYETIRTEWTLRRILYSNDADMALLHASAALALLALLLRRVNYPAVLLAYGLLLVAYPFGFIVYHADAMEINRHAFLLAVSWRLALWLLILHLWRLAWEGQQKTVS